MTPRPALSVIVPTLEESLLVRDLVAGLHATEGEDRPDEVLVVDGGSLDGTAELARSAGARVVVSAPGRGVQLASGARAAQGDVLVFLHADARLASGALARVRAAFANDAALEACAFAQRIDARGLFYRSVERCANLRAALGVVYGDSGLCVRREVYEAVGGFAELPLFEDLDLSRRLAKRRRPRLLRDAGLVLSARRWRAEGALRCTSRNWMLTLLFLAGVSPHALARFYPPVRRSAGEG